MNSLRDPTRQGGVVPTLFCAGCGRQRSRGTAACKPQDGNAQPQSGLSPEIAPLLESIRELTSAVRRQACSSSSHGKRDAHPRPGEVAKQLQNMSVADR